MKKYLKIIRKILIILIFSLIIGISINSTVENIIISKQILDFKKKGVFQENISTSTEKYYLVSRETWMPDIPAFYENNGRKYYGSSGDLLLGLKSAIEGIPVVEEFITYNFGGHAASVCYEYYGDKINYEPNQVIESSTVYEEGVVVVNGEYWKDNNYRDQVIGVRLKVSEEKKKKAFEYMVSKVGLDYNNLFIFNTKNSFYCTDLISRAYETVGIDLNYDGFYTSVQDLIASDETYIFFYKEYKKGIEYYYYLG